ncbi:hypothetical protein [Corallococcus sp. AS-1-6]|uniref:hypothetical protein n=1 Tax=Corallococcus sp. AS-1-6 TaxID=2874599 RepID=UPI001CBF2328|nr:hypothetical protein [Corallococcus sp. AS-1-6]MBZ4373262.1 hypothetical protein [Corallococcus sp. AS-1-6]
MSRVIEVELVGPRSGQSCVLAGFEFSRGVALVPADAGAALSILATYHSAYPRESREYEKARDAWEDRQASSGGKLTTGGDLVDDLKAQLEAANREREELAARLARAEGAGKGTSISATEASAAPPVEAQEKPPKPAKAAK